MIHTFKIIFQIYNIKPANYFTTSAAQHNHATRHAANINIIGDDLVQLPTTNLTKLNANGNPRRHFLTHRVVNSWNNLSQDTKLATTLNEFKNKYDKELE